MPALRKLIVVGCMLAVGAGVLVDARHAEPDRLGARIYVASVLGYQRFGRPVVRRYVVCRFHPSCSDYSLEAVRRFGFTRGLRLTVKRLLRCRPGAIGGPDPVPTSASGAGHAVEGVAGGVQ